MKMRIVPITLLAVLLGGCDLITDLSEERSRGAIGYPDALHIELSDSAQAGEATRITVRTLGTDGCWRKDETRLVQDDLTATFTPYDMRRWTRGTMCPTEPVEIFHEAEIVFERAGTATIIIRGRDGTVQREIVVR